jgi:signal transduction histidine kinase
MTSVQAADAGWLRAGDLVRFNEWLWITRLRSIAGIVLIVALLAWLSPIAVLESGPVLGMCAGYVVVSLAYRRWLQTGQHLRALTYVQLMGDTLVLTIGLLFVYQDQVLFHFLFLLAVLPASMMETRCGILIASMATAGHAALLWAAGSTEWTSVGALLPPAIFFLTASQSLFYAHQLRRKNRALATAATSLNETNQRLEEEAAISSALLRSAQALTSSLDPREIRERLTESARSALGCDVGITFVRDDKLGTYRVGAVSGRDADMLDEIRAFEPSPAQAGTFETVARHGAVLLPGRDSGLFPPVLLDRWGLDAFLCADLRCAGTSVGLLAAGYHARTDQATARELRLASSIAQQAALALENARLVEGLRDAGRLKSEFIGTMSHELRSPLNVVMGYVDLLLDGDLGSLEDEQRKALSRVQHHSLQLLELIEETLDINRLEAGRLPVDLETFPVNDFVTDLRDSIPSDWFKPEVATYWQLDPHPALLRSDRAKLKKVLRNLIHNALKFTERGSVTVQVSTRDGWVEFTVSDTGVGISADALPVIFEMFRQVDGSPTRRHRGVGLGLYIVRQLVRGLGGEITVTSEAGVGSTFHVRLPHRLEMAPQDRTAPEI